MVNEFIKESPIIEITKQNLEVFTVNTDVAKQIAHPHIHKAIEILYVLKGKYKMFAGNEEFNVSEGDFCLFRSETVHRTYSIADDEGSYLVIKIEPSIILNLVNEEYGISYVLQFMLQRENSKILWAAEELSGSEIQLTLTKIHEEYLKNGYAKEYALKIYASKLLLDILRYENADNKDKNTHSDDITITKQIYKAMVFINENYANNITVSDCAKYVNMSYSYFSRSFKRITGNSFREYLNRIRINQAEKLLLSTDKSITDICFACGYNDASYFIAQYKLLRGKTPFCFRNS